MKCIITDSDSYVFKLGSNDETRSTYTMNFACIKVQVKVKRSTYWHCFAHRTSPATGL